VIPPGRRIGILGGGQLGTFFSIAARQFGYQVCVWDPDPKAPAHAWADINVHSDFDDVEGRRFFVKTCEAASYEWENIPVALVEAIEADIPVRPGSRVLSLLQNRITEKGFLSEHGFPVTPYVHIHAAAQLHAAVDQLGLPVFCKTATAGYDGHGQRYFREREEIDALVSELPPCPTGWIVEKSVPFVKELSVIAVRNEAGKVVLYPPSENRHEAGILRQCHVPAQIETTVSERLSSLAKAVITALKGAGVFCIEFFLKEDGALLINEIAPRPHNSGHYSLDVCAASQFEQQLRVLCGLPIERPRLLSPATTINILGFEIDILSSPKDLEVLLAIEGSRIYQYRKKGIKKRRKMGHITLVHSSPDALITQSETVQSLLARAAGPSE